MPERARLSGLEAISGLLTSKGLPPVDQWHPESSRDIDMRIARDGRWFYRGSLIHRQRMVRLFSTVLRCDEDGVTWLVMPHEKLRISVEDAHFTATLLASGCDNSAPSLSFTTNVGDTITANAAHPIRVHYAVPGGEPSPYLRIRGRLDALISRTSFVELANLAETRSGRLGVESCGHFMTLDESAA